MRRLIVLALLLCCTGQATKPEPSRSYVLALGPEFRIVERDVFEDSVAANDCAVRVHLYDAKSMRTASYADARFIQYRCEL